MASVKSASRIRDFVERVPQCLATFSPVSQGNKHKSTVADEDKSSVADEDKSTVADEDKSTVADEDIRGSESDDCGQGGSGAKLGVDAIQRNHFTRVISRPTSPVNEAGSEDGVARTMQPSRESSTPDVEDNLAQDALPTAARDVVLHVRLQSDCRRRRLRNLTSILSYSR